MRLAVANLYDLHRAVGVEGRYGSPSVLDVAILSHPFYEISWCVETTRWVRDGGWRFRCRSCVL